MILCFVYKYYGLYKNVFIVFILFRKYSTTNNKTIILYIFFFFVTFKIILINYHVSRMNNFIKFLILKFIIIYTFIFEYLYNFEF